jgi:hypothetical protein
MASRIMRDEKMVEQTFLSVPGLYVENEVRM